MRSCRKTLSTDEHPHEKWAKEHLGRHREIENNREGALEVGTISNQENRKIVKRGRRDELSTLPAVDPAKLVWNQETAILDTTELICALMKEGGVSRSDLASRMGTTKGNITQILDGSRNMTIRTVSDVLTHLGHEFRASCKSHQTGERPHSAIVVRVSIDIRLPEAGRSAYPALPSLAPIAVEYLPSTISLAGTQSASNHSIFQPIGA